MSAEIISLHRQSMSQAEKAEYFVRLLRVLKTIIELPRRKARDEALMAIRSEVD